jgi:hypothetical protein
MGDLDLFALVAICFIVALDKRNIKSMLPAFVIR